MYYIIINGGTVYESNVTSDPSDDQSSTPRHTITNDVQPSAEPTRASSYPKENKKYVEEATKQQSHCILNSHYCTNHCTSTCPSSTIRYTNIKPYQRPVVVTKSLLDRTSKRLWSIYDSHIKKH